MTTHQKKRSVLGSRYALVIAVVIASFLAAFLGQVLITTLSLSPTLLPEPGIIVRQGDDVFARLSRAAQSVYAAQRAAFVTLYESAATKPAEGLVISSDGWIVYIYDETRPAFKPASVRLDSGEFAAVSEVAADPATDLRFVKIERERLEPVAIAQSKTLSQLIPVLSVSHDGLASVTYVTGTAVIPLQPLSSDRFVRLPHVLRSGLAGQALFDEKGELVALAMAGDGVSNMAQLIPAEQIRTATLSILKSNKVVRPAIGIQYLDLAQSATPASPMRSGALVVSASSAAAKAGIRTNDIVTAVDGIPLSDRVGLSDIVLGSDIGGTRELSVFRNGVNVSLTLPVVTAP